MHHNFIKYNKAMNFSSVCGDVPSISDGSIALQENGNKSYGALANVICDTGYNATSVTIQCLDTGKWQDTSCNIVGM